MGLITTAMNSGLNYASNKLRNDTSIKTTQMKLDTDVLENEKNRKHQSNIQSKELEAKKRSDALKLIGTVIGAGALIGKEALKNKNDDNDSSNKPQANRISDKMGISDQIPNDLKTSGVRDIPYIEQPRYKLTTPTLSTDVKKLAPIVGGGLLLGLPKLFAL